VVPRYAKMHSPRYLERGYRPSTSIKSSTSNSHVNHLEDKVLAKGGRNDRPLTTHDVERNVGCVNWEHELCVV
jgi:hypothetical protein